MLTRSVVLPLLLLATWAPPAHTQSEGERRQRAQDQARAEPRGRAQAGEGSGPPEKTTDRTEGRLKVSTRVYRTSAGQVAAEFVEGVLIRFSMTSN